MGLSLASKKLQGANTTEMRKLIKLVKRAKDKVVEVDMGDLRERGNANGGILLGK